MSPVKHQTSKKRSRSEPLTDLAQLAKALAHPARLQIIATLLSRNRCIGCDLVEETGLAASTTSEHLRILKAAGIITGSIERPRVCYSLNPAALLPLQRFLDSISTVASVPVSARRPR